MSEKVAICLKRKHSDDNNDNIKQKQIDNENSSKREKLTESSSESSSSEDDAETCNNYLLSEALKRIVELQNELEDLDNKTDISVDDDLEISLVGTESDLRNYEAEALGFAMCARETLLFLQREGISQDSPVYRALKNRLIGKCNGVPI